RAPVRARPQPHRKGFGEILVGMALRVPQPQMLDEIPAGRIGPVVARVAPRARAEQMPPLAPPRQRVAVLHHVAGLVAQNRHALGPGAALDVDDHLALEPDQPRVRQIERDTDAGGAVRAEPLAGNPGVRPYPQTRLRQLVMQALHAVFEPGALHGEVEVLEPELEQLLVGQIGPGKFLCTRHGFRGDNAKGAKWSHDPAMPTTVQYPSLAPVALRAQAQLWRQDSTFHCKSTSTLRIMARDNKKLNSHELAMERFCPSVPWLFGGHTSINDG